MTPNKLYSSSPRYVVAMACASLVLLCSCRTFTVPNPSAPSPATVKPAAPTPLQVSEAQAMPRPAAASQPPRTTQGYYPPTLPTATQLASHQAACDCCGGRCGHRARGQVTETFQFSDSFPMHDPNTQWAPDGLERPWPHDEYIWDGGDRNHDVSVNKDKTIVFGVDLEDTVVHYDTIAGKTEVSESNRVPIYAPRFAAVRHIVSMVEDNNTERVAQADKQLIPTEQIDQLNPTNVNQPLPPVTQLGVREAQIMRERNAGLTAENTRNLAQASSEFLPYEQFKIIRQGIMDANEKLRLSQAALSAAVWMENKSVQVILDGDLPSEAVHNLKLGETIMYDRQGKPRMRIIKIADKSEAKPGEIVRFTLRFDNIGDQKVSNVTILDNLTSRLEYVPESQECSHKHEFNTAPNEGETAVLRWTINDPLRAGEGGIIRFQCRVR